MLQYLSSTISVGNPVFGLTNVNTCALRGMTFVGSRFALTLVESGGSLYWKFIDTYSDTTVSYDVPFTPAQAGLAASDVHESVTGQFLASDSAYLYYMNGSTVKRINIETGTDAGSQILRSSSMAVIPAAAVGGITVKGSMLYLVSKSQQLLYVFNMNALAWDGSSTNAVRQVTVSELATHTLCGLFTQSGSDTDVVLLLKNGSTSAVAIKFTLDLLTRKGQTEWTSPSTNIVAAQFKGSILHVVKNDPTTAGSGVLIHRFGDGSTDIVAKEKTILALSDERVKAGSGKVVKITFSAKDGYNQTFPITDKVRFSLMKVGEAFDKNDGALGASANSTFRNSSDEPISTSLEISFDSTGKAECFWHTPIEVPVDVLLHRIKVEYPIPS
jgi:hypothetical protein